MPKRPSTLTFFVNAADEHEWNFKAPNNTIIGSSSESYKERRKAAHNASLVLGVTVHDRAGKVYTRGDQLIRVKVNDK